MFFKKFVKANLLPIIAVFYAITITVLMIALKNVSVMKFHSYFTAIVSFIVTYYVLNFIIKVHDTGIRLYIALGICCLTLGNLYFILLDIVSISPDILSVGTFAKVCCYLFFISALTSIKAVTHKNKKPIIVINIVSAIASIACAYSVITNNIIVVNIAVLLLDILCISLASGLLSNSRVRFFALIILIIASMDILYLIVALAVFISSLSPALYVLLAQSVISLKAGERHA